MECVRCKGLMVAGSYSEMKQTGGLEVIQFWRCINCGEVVDPLIHHYRSLSKSSHGRFPQVMSRRLRFSPSSDSCVQGEKFSV